MSESTLETILEKLLRPWRLSYSEVEWIYNRLYDELVKRQPTQSKEKEGTLEGKLNRPPGL